METDEIIKRLEKEYENAQVEIMKAKKTVLLNKYSLIISKIPKEIEKDKMKSYLDK